MNTNSDKIANQKPLENIGIFPEYIFVFVPQFNDVVKQEADEWLYIIKHSDIRADFKSPYMTKIKKALSISNMSDKERTEYSKYLKETAEANKLI